MLGLFEPISADENQSIAEVANVLRERLPWLWEPAFKIGAHEGYDGRSFGARAGTLENVNLKNVLHEVSHAVELTLLPTRVWKRRIKRAQYELRIKSYNDLFGQRYYEPVTMQATERECRVGGIQLRLLEMGDFDTKDFVQDFAITLKYMADYYEGGSCPLNQHDVSKYNEEQRRWLNTRVDLIMKAYNEFTPEIIMSRWHEVMAWLGKSNDIKIPHVSESLDQSYSQV